MSNVYGHLARGVRELRGLRSKRRRARVIYGSASPIETRQFRSFARSTIERTVQKHASRIRLKSASPGGRGCHRAHKHPQSIGRLRGARGGENNASGNQPEISLAGTDRGKENHSEELRVARNAEGRNLIGRCVGHGVVILSRDPRSTERSSINR